MTEIKNSSKVIDEIYDLLNDKDIPETETLNIIENIVGIDYLVEEMWERVRNIEDEDEANNILIYLKDLKKKYTNYTISDFERIEI